MQLTNQISGPQWTLHIFDPYSIPAKCEDRGLSCRICEVTQDASKALDLSQWTMPANTTPYLPPISMALGHTPDRYSVLFP